MKVWISEFTYTRLIDGLGEELPVISINEQGWRYLNLDKEIVDNALENFGMPLDHALNEMINHNQRVGLWPKKRS